MSKSYIIELFDKYYLACKEGKYVESYSPVDAMQFQSAKEALAWGKAKSTFSEYMKAVDYNEAVAKFEEWVADGYVRRELTMIDENVSIKYDPKKHTPLDVLKFHLAKFENENKISREIYRSWPEMWEVFKAIHSVERFHEANDYTKSFISFEISVNSKTTFEEFEKDIELVFPYITLLNDKGEHIIGIFDHRLHEGGASSILTRCKMGGWYVVSGRGTVEVSKTTLRQCFEYIKQNRYYE